MSDRDEYLPDDALAEIVLEGGPPDLPCVTRDGDYSLSAEILKIQHRNGYEHFERVGEPADVGPLVFRWTMRTKIAE